MKYLSFNLQTNPLKWMRKVLSYLLQGKQKFRKREVICPRIEVEEVVEVKVGKGLVIS